MTKHHILVGSIEVINGLVRAGVHIGENEYAPKDLRYIQADPSVAEKGETIQDFFGKVYDASEGCLVVGNFRMKDAA